MGEVQGDTSPSGLQGEEKAQGKARDFNGGGDSAFLFTEETAQRRNLVCLFLLPPPTPSPYPSKGY